MIYNIAGVRVDMDLEYPRTIRQSEPYLDTEAQFPDLTIRLNHENIAVFQKEHPNFTLEDCEYVWLGAEFYNWCPEFGMLLLHSSAVVYEDRAYLFSAPSGTGKSTHTQLWLKRFKGSYILNDDKPAIKWTDKGFYVYGTPFSGKTDLNVNTGVPLQGICIIERGLNNTIEKVNSDEALFGILDQTMRPYTEERMDKLLALLDKLVKNVDVYRLKCNMDIEAAEVSYNAMKGKRLR